MLSADFFSELGNTQTESEGMEKVFHANRSNKKARVAIRISDKIGFK